MFSPAVAKTLRFVAGIPDEDQPDLQEPRPYTPAPSVSTYNDPTDMGTQATPVNYPSSNATSVDPTISDPNYVSPSSNTPPSITIADGRTEPPTPQGDWQPVETVPAPSQVPYGPPLSEAGPEQTAEQRIQSTTAPAGRIAAPQTPMGPEVPPAPAYAPRAMPEQAPAAPVERPSFDPLAALEQYGEPGRKLAAELRRAYRDPSQGINPWTVYEALQAIPFEVVSRARRELIPDAEAKRDAGTDPVAPFRDAAAALGLPLPSPEELNPEGRPASDIGITAGLTAVAPDPFDPAAGLALNTAGRAIGAGVRGVGAAGRAIGNAVAPIVDDAAAAGRAALQAGGDAPTPQMMGSGFIPNAADEMRSYVVPPEVARQIPGGVRLPDDDAFRAAVEGTPGARITTDGLEVDVQRFQKPKQAGEPVIRGGVHYEPVDERKYYRSSASNPVGGPQEISGSTLFQSPLVVGQGATPGQMTLEALRGRGAVEALDQQIDAALDPLFSDAMGAYAPRRGMAGQIASSVTDLLGQHGVSAEEAGNVVKGWTRTPGRSRWDLRDAVLEAVAGAEARAAGHDSIVQMSNRSGTPALGEIVDVREATYPTRSGGYSLRPEFQPGQSRQPWQMTRSEYEDGTLLHGTRAPEFEQFESGNALANYFTDPRDLRPGQKPYAESFASDGGRIIRVQTDAGRTKAFDPTNDEQARAIYDRVMADETRWPRGVHSKPWQIEYFDSVPIIREAQKDGYNQFRFWEPAASQFSTAISDPSIIRQLPDHRAAVEAAIARGERVPSEVLADYPDLAPRAGSGFVPRGADLRNAAQGGVIGAASELTSDEELTPQERLARMGLGAGLGVAAGRRAGRGVVQRAGSGMVPESSGSWDDIARRMDSPEQRAAREAASQPPRRANGDQAIREQFGRPWEEVAPATPGSADQLGDATRQMVTEGQNFKGTRNRVLPADMEQIGGPVKIEPQSMSLNSVGGGLVGAGAGANSDEDLTDQERFERAAMGMVVGGVFMRRPKGQAAAAAADPTMQRMARMMNGPQVPTVANKRGLLERWAQAMTDDRAGLRTLQEAVSAKLGRPLGAGEMVAELTRRNSASIAGQRLAEELRPAIVKVGDDDDYLAQYLIHSHNVDVAREIGQRTYDDAIKSGATPAVASARAMQAANARKFSGDLTIAETQQQLAAIQQRVAGLPDGATRWQNIQDAAQAVWDMNKKTLERKRDAGIISDDLYNELTQRYPRYVRTDIADYFDKGAGGGAATGPKRVGLSDIGVQKISAEGTAKERINPLYSTLDQTYAAEAAIARNESGQAFEELLRIDPTWQATFKEVTPAQGVNVGNPATTVPAGYTLRNGEQFLKVWKNGEARTFVVPPEYAALVSPQTGRVLGDNPAANGWRTLMQTYKSLITSKNPAFSYLVSPVRDLGDYAIQEATESAGKTQGVMGAAKAVGALPGILADYARAVPDVFAGITEGVYKGDLATMMRNGAGMMSRPQRNAKELKQAYEELRRTNGMEIRSMDDMKRVIGNVLTLGAEPVGGRLEQIPRLSAARRAARRGATPLDQTMRFRDATIDFQRAGEWSRVANELVPFFNVAVQSGAQTVRNFKKNPAAALASVAAVVGTPAILAEVWNHRDEQTARDYGDVPDYLKKTGIIWMVPGVEGRNERGDRLPNYLYIPVGQYGALVQTAKETAQKAAAGKSDAPDLASVSGWAALAADIGGIFSPIRGDSAASAATSLIPPGLSTAADLAADTDLYRGSKISTDQRDENASALSQASAAGFNAVTGKETRPSQWEHTYRDLGGYAATLATTGSNMLAEATGQRRPKDEDRPIQSAPIVGGLVNRIVRDSGGQRMEDARSENTRVPESIRPILQEAGMLRDDVTGVSSKYKGAPLTREEQERWQTITNSLVSRKLAEARRDPAWRERGADKEKLVRAAIAEAREEAAARALRRLTDDEIEKRKRRESSRKAS